MGREAIENRRLVIAGELIERAIPHARDDRMFPIGAGRLLTSDRRFGSRDRRYYRELIYTAVRFLPWIESVPVASRALAALWLSFDGEATRDARAVLLPDGTPPAATLDELAALFTQAFPGADATTATLVPEWTHDECPALLEQVELTTIHKRAPLCLRIRPADMNDVLHDLANERVQASADPRIPGAARVLSGPDVTRSNTYAEGRVEVQDIGSQWVLHTVAPLAGERWLDACAGAGGKTLQLAELVGAQTPVVAHDIRAAALDELRSRAARAGITSIRVVQTIEGEFDAVLVDAPCSGSGTWRRSPHLKLQTSRDDLRQAAAQQLALLRTFSNHVRLGGRLVYATCSLASIENAGTVRAFLAQDPRFAPATPGSDPIGVTLLPSTLDSDGFFVAVLRRGGT